VAASNSVFGDPCGGTFKKLAVLYSCTGGETGESLAPVADAHVRRTSRRSNHGSASSLIVDDAPDRYETLLKFSVPTLPGKVTRAKLRLFVTNGTGSGPKVYPTTNNWSENSVDWNNRPTITGSVLADLGSVGTGWVEIDVTPTITAFRDYTFLLRPDSDDGMRFDSRQGTNKPQLNVVADPGT
jgi:hypothetical protein